MTRTVEYYRTHPKARAKRLRDQARINRRPKERKRRVALRRERRKRGIDGKGGPDISHTKSGKVVLEDPSINRARKGLREDKKGKPCGNSYIPKKHKCSKKGGKLTPSTVKVAGSIALTAGALAGGTYLAKKFKESKNTEIPLTTEEWRKSPKSARNKPKLSVEENERIIKEAIAGGKKWDVQERLNKFNQSRCQVPFNRRDNLENLFLTLARGDSEVESRCLVGSGAFGNYYVHTSKKYGVKVSKGHFMFTNEEMNKGFEWEFDQLDKAHKAGIKVPEALAIRSPYMKGDREKRRRVMTIRHMEGYESVGKVYPYPNNKINLLADKAPLIVKVKILREFRKLNLAGLAHGDGHAQNILVHKKSKRISLIDFGNSMSIQDWEHPLGHSMGYEHLSNDLNALPQVLSGPKKGKEFFDREDINTSLENTIQAAAQITYSTRENGIASKSEWKNYRDFITEYYSLFERDLLHDAYLTANRLQILRKARRSRG